MERIWNKFIPLDKNLSNGTSKQSNNTPLKRKVFVGMSGGVDSSVAAMLLKKQGYDVVGVFMRCFSSRGGSASGGNAPWCTTERDAQDARRAAEHLGIPFYTWNFEEEYKKRVVKYMIEGYKKGITPNPDVECNREIKFGLFLDRALKMGADFVATGHYVRCVRGKKLDDGKLDVRSKMLDGKDVSNIQRPTSNFLSLFEARDKNKDQSYFLWTLTQKQLKHCLFPIGDYLKPEVREMAREAGLPTADKKDSQGICFLGKVSLDDFLKNYLTEKKGAVLDTAGKKLGEHSGAYFYTIGQRQGIGNLKHQKGVKLHKPLYVVSKDVKKNVVTVAEEDDPDLARKEVELTGLNFINSEHSNIPACRQAGCRTLEVMTRVRYRQQLCEAKLCKSPSSTYSEGGFASGGKATADRQIANRLPSLKLRRTGKSQNFRLIFKAPQKFVAAGQSAVFYVKDGGEFQMLGGGVIL